jgi:hypothetical protein
MEQLTTVELLAEFDQYMQQSEVAAIIAELKARVIKENDSDATAKSTGGVRPLHHPIV